MGVALADQLGTSPFVFPGDHMGFDVVAEAFAATLDRVLRELPAA